MIHKYSLRNGIPVFVVESHASAVVSIHAVVTRGSVHEPGSLAGISHFLEHSLFKGTKRRKVGQIALEIETHGGEINAFTSFEETAYYTTLASRYFAEGLDVIADAVTRPTFDPIEMEKEKEVILEEIKRAHDSPHRVQSMNLWKTAFAGTPYGQPVLGFEPTVRKITARTLRSYFDKNYHAGTLSLFVVGDIDRDRVHQLASEQLSRIPVRSTPKMKPIRFPKILTPKLVSATKEIEETYLQIGIPVGGITDLATAEIDLMCTALGQGESSRLFQRLVKDNPIALEAQMGLVATGHCGLVVISLLLAPENTRQAVSETYRLLSEVAQHGLTEDEIDRVKTSLEAHTTFGKETVDGYARRLGYYYCEFGTPDHEATYLDELMSVTPDEATKTISNVFKKAPILSVVHPKGAPIDSAAILHSARSGFTPAKKVAIHRPAIHKEVRAGVTFVSKKATTLPTISLRMFFHGGSRIESPSQLGLGTLFSRVWSSGTQSFSSLEIAKRLESLGASIQVYCGRYTAGLSVECLTKHWHSVRPMLEEILVCPTFPQEELDTEKHLLLREIFSERDSPGALVHLNLMERLFPNHPYGRSALGKKETVEPLTRTHLLDFFKSSIRQDRLVIATVGDFRQDFFSDLEHLCLNLPTTKSPAFNQQSIVTPTHPQAVSAHKSPLHQSHLMVGFVAPALHDPDRYALKLLSSALSGQGGRLFLELRDRQSLAYSVSPMHSDGPEAGMFAFYIGCSPEKWHRSLKGIRLEIEKVLATPLAKNELARAKQYWLGRFELDMQRNASQCFTFGLDEVYGLGHDHYLKVPDLIRSISAKQILAAADQYLRPEIATISIVHHEPLAPSEIIAAWLPDRGIKHATAPMRAEAV